MQYYMQIDSMLRLNVWLINNNNIKYIYNSNNSNYKYIKYIISSFFIVSQKSGYYVSLSKAMQMKTVY